MSLVLDLVSSPTHQQMRKSFAKPLRTIDLSPIGLGAILSAQVIGALSPVLRLTIYRVPTPPMKDPLLRSLRIPLRSFG